MGRRWRRRRRRRRKKELMYKSCWEPSLERRGWVREARKKEKATASFERIKGSQEEKVMGWPGVSGWSDGWVGVYGCLPFSAISEDK